MKKKTLIMALVVCLIAVVAIGGTLAYFTDNEEKVNTFTMGKVDITLTESKWEAPDNTYPGIAYPKNPVVTNVGDDPAWIRVDVTLSDAKAFMDAAAKHNITDLSMIFAGHDESKWMLAGKNYDSTKNTLTYSYYYKALLDPNKDTGEIFTSVKIPGAFNVADMSAIGTDFTITVQAHAIQTSDDYNTVEEAFAAYVFEAK